MNEVYNIMDVFTLSTSGEGFGVPIIEAMACGVPCVVTDYTTTNELLNKNGQCGIAVPVITNITGTWNVERAFIDIDKMSDAFQILHDDKKLREKMGQIGIKKVEKYYNWKTIIPKWNKLIKEMCNE